MARRSPVRWRRRLAIGVAIAAAVLVVIGIGAVALLHSAAFHRWALRTIDTRATAAVGAPVNVGQMNLHLNLHTPSVDLDQVRVAGTGPNAPPLFTAQRIVVGVAITSLLHRQWHLSRLEIDSPVVRIESTAAGTTNLPAASPSAAGRSSGSGLAPWFHEFSIRRVTIRQGTVIYRDQARRLQADLYGLDVAASFDPAALRYRGTISYQRGEIQYGSYPALPNTLQAQFAVTPQTATIESADLNLGNSRLHVAGSLSDFSQPQVEAQYTAMIDTGELGRFSGETALPIGTLTTQGTLAYDSRAGVWTRALRVAGTVSAPRLALTAPAALAATGVGARYAFADGDLSVGDARAGVAGGELNANLHIADITGAARAQAQVRAQALSLQQLARLVAPQPNPAVQTSGQLSAQARLQWQGALHDLDANFQAHGQGTVRKVNDGAPLPIVVAVAGAYRAQSATLTLTQGRLQTPNIQVQAVGTASRNSHMQLSVRVADLSALAHLAAMVNAPQAQQLGLAGAGSFQGTLAGALVPGRPPALTVSGLLTAAPLSVRGTEWRLAQVRLTASPTQVTLANGVLQPANMGEIRFSAQAALRNWQPGADLPLAASAQASGLDAAMLAQLAGHAGMAGGRLAAQLSLHGTLQHPRGSGRATLSGAAASRGQAAEPATLAGQPIRTLTAQFQGSGSRLSAGATLVMDAGSVQVNGTYAPPTQAYTVSLSSPHLDLSRLAVVRSRGVPVRGTLTVTANGAGTLSNPAGTLQVQAAALQVAGQPVQGMQLTAQVANHVAHIALGTQAADTTLRGQATVQLSGNYFASGNLDTTAIPLAALVALYAPSMAPAVGGSTQLQASFSGPLRQPLQMSAQARMPTFVFDYQATAAGGFANGGVIVHAPTPARASASPAALTGATTTRTPGGATTVATSTTPGGTTTVTTATAPGAVAPPGAIALHATNPIVLSYAQGVLRVQPVTIAGTDTALTVSGTVPVKSLAASTLTAQGTVNLDLLQRFDPEFQTAGTLRLDVHASGVSAAAVTGQIQIVDATLASDAMPVAVENANGTLTLGGNRLTIASFSARVGGGSLTAHGALDYAGLLSGGGVDAASMNLSTAAERIGIDYPTGVHEMLSAHINWTGTGRSSTLSGAVSIDQLAFSQNFDITSLSGGIGGSSLTTPSGFEDHVHLQVAVNSANELTAASRTMSLQATANLMVQGTLAEPVVLGRLDLIRGAVIEMGNRYVLQSGTVDFANPTVTEPVLNLTANTTIEQYDIYLHLQGPPDRMRTNFSSTPPLPPADIINLLAFGQTTEAAAASPQSGSLGAESLIASGVSGQLTSRVARIAGISQLSVDPELGTNTQSPGARITVQQQVTGNLYVTFSTDVTSTQEEVVQLQYQLSPQVSLEAVRDQNGGFAFMTRWKRNW